MRILFFGKADSEISSAIQKNLAKRDASTDIAHSEEEAYELLLGKPDLVIIAEQCKSVPLIARGKTDAPIMYVHSKPLKNSDELKEKEIRHYQSDKLVHFYVDLSLFIGRIEAGEGV